MIEDPTPDDLAAALAHALRAIHALVKAVDHARREAGGWRGGDIFLGTAEDEIKKSLSYLPGDLQKIERRIKATRRNQ